MTCDRLGMILHMILSISTLAATTFLAATHVIGADAAMVVVVGVAGISGVTISRNGQMTHPDYPPGTTILTPPPSTTTINHPPSQ